MIFDLSINPIMKSIFKIIAAFLLIFNFSSCQKNEYADLANFIESKHGYEYRYLSQVLVVDQPVNILYDNSIWESGMAYSQAKKEYYNNQDAGERLKRENMGRSKAINAGWSDIYLHSSNEIRNAEEEGRKWAEFYKAKMDSIKADVEVRCNDLLSGSIAIDSICTGWIVYSVSATEKMRQNRQYKNDVTFYNKDFSIKDQYHYNDFIEALNEILPPKYRFRGITIYHKGEAYYYEHMQTYGPIDREK